MQQIEMTILAVLLSTGVVAVVLLGRREVRRSRQRRAELLAGREDISAEALAHQIAGDVLDVKRVLKELLGLAKALCVPAGKLRPDDIVAELLGKSVLTGDDLLEIEFRLQRNRPEAAQRRLTVEGLVRELASISE